MTLAAALIARDVSRLPSRRDEDWRWTDLRGLIRELPPQAPAAPAPDGAGPFGDLGEAELVVVNGRPLGGAQALVLAAGERRTVRLRLVSVSLETAHGTTLAVSLGEGAHLTLLESHEGLAEDYVADIQLKIDLEAEARLDRVVLAQDGALSVAVTQAHVDLAPGARLFQTTLTTGARRQRLETVVRHPGQGAHVQMDGVYLLTGRSHADLTSAVTHAGLDGTTNQLVKGVASGQARGVFQGRITVEPGADRTDARMGHHALILDDRAEVDAKPELLIFADDVACAHGNTVGALDEDALFYARQRGVPEAEARALLTSAFVGEVVDRIADEAVREAVAAWAAARRVG
ncbi:Fe-S cluster assembly protein SufD [Phenylobacterium sp.]|uniref:Fe-S cluster assembly protein SufD n=1 Tax=Phenylobacterium sp. TaxID=1871053 RepID=UPI002FD8BC99